MGFWLIGYAFAYSNVYKFIGFDPKLAASNGFEDIEDDNYLYFVFYVAFALTSSTIVLGALAERTKLRCYIIYSFIHTSFLYPVVIGWTQSEGGWLYDLGYYDFAGTSTVFMVGGAAGLVGTYLLGERYGKDKVRKAMQAKDEERERALKASAVVFEDNHKFEKIISKVNTEYHEAFKEWLTNHSTNEFRPYNQTYIVTGCLIVAIGWLFLAGGSCNSLFDERANIAPKVIMNTLISGCTACVLAVFIKPQVLGTYSFVNRYDCVASCGGFLAGLVGVTGCANYLEPYGALVIGITSSLVYIGGCKLLDFLHIDDPIEACPVNLFCGIWGSIVTAFFHN